MAHGIIYQSLNRSSTIVYKKRYIPGLRILGVYRVLWKSRRICDWAEPDYAFALSV